MKTANLPDGFVLVTQLRVMDREQAITNYEEQEEEPVYDSKIGWKVMLGCWAVSMFFAFFFCYGLYKAFCVFFEKVGLGG